MLLIDKCKDYIAIVEALPEICVWMCYSSVSCVSSGMANNPLVEGDGGVFSRGSMV
jgi:hypothetical protein